MSQDDTKVSDTTDVSEDTNDKLETEGKGDTEQPKTQVQEKTLTQSEVNKLVAKARTEGRDSGRQAALKEHEGKHVLTQEELDARLKAAIDGALKEQALVSVRRAIQTEYGLNDAQLAKLSGDDEKALREDAEATFGALKKKDAPVLTPGGIEREVSDNEDTNSWLKKNISRRRAF